MHRVLVREVVIDAPSEHFDTVADFWSGLLDSRAVPIVVHPEFSTFPEPAALMWVGLQRIDDGTARFHLDIETDDVEAEVARLTKLGGTEQARHRSWVVMQDPVGLLFCVVPPQSEEFQRRAKSVE
jgi:hypothetical protein